ncbi:MAG: acyltransferase domain-containing protein [Tetrasphaera sp.]
MPSRQLIALFPGQGSYLPSALASLAASNPDIERIIADVDAAAQKVLGRSVSQSLLDPGGPGIDTLLETDPELLQLAIYAIDVAAYAAARSQGLTADILLGHSFGEIPALVSAGAWTIAQGAEIVCHRTRVLAEHADPGAAMFALGLDRSAAEHLLALVDGRSVVSVENHARQTVVTVPDDALPAVSALTAALRVSHVRLNSPYAFHSPFVAAAEAAFAERVAGSHPSSPLRTPVYSPIEQRYYNEDEDLARVLTTHLTRPVRFDSAVRWLSDNGASVFVECGALGNLSGMVAKILADRAHETVILLRRDAASGAGIADAVAGLVRAPQARAVSVAALREAFAPDCASDLFAAFWKDQGPRVSSLVGSAYAEWARSKPAAVAPQPEDNGRPGLAVVATSPGSPGGEPTTPGMPARAEVLARVVRIYAEALEYPPEVLVEHTDLESELGVDSVKQAELLARVGEVFDLPPRPDGFRATDFGTLGRVTDLVLANLPDAPSPTPAAESMAPADSRAVVGLNREEVLARVVRIYADALEYPPEVLVEHTDLESELGVDSVKQAELLARVGEVFDLPPRPDGFRATDFGTLGRVTDLVLGVAA